MPSNSPAWMPRVTNYIVKPFNAATLKSKLVGVFGEF
jgi:hypothetical protein